jgi:pseudouridine kinase
MTQREKEIIAILKEEPTISQDELALRLNITRSSVAVHITNLIKKGIILGKGYVVNEEPYVVVIGGSNIDIQGIPNQKLIQKDSNIGHVNISHGGVGRNIAENCTRLNIPTRLISVLGQDLYGQSILAHANSIGLHMNDSLILHQQKTSTYLSILDEHHDLALAINDMDIMNALTKEFILSKKRLLEHAQLIVCDTNLSEEVIEAVISIAKHIPVFIDTVSTTKALKIKPYLSKIHTLKPNKAELYALVDPNHTLDLHAAAKLLPCPYAYISLGSQGVLIKDHDSLTHLNTPPIEVANATGAGDAFMAGLVYAYLNQFSSTQSATMAMSASRIALQSESTISNQLNEDTCLNTMKETYHV